jgi:hypothetical protein
VDRRGLEVRSCRGRQESLVLAVIAARKYTSTAKPAVCPGWLEFGLIEPLALVLFQDISG